MRAFAWQSRKDMKPDVEENALRATIGDAYRAYAAQHKRLVPLVW
jgi:protein-S-isoprenylcysteine O-methyltransferase Ste14